MPALRKAKGKPFSKEILSKGYGFHTPQDGSVCKIKIIDDEKQVINELNENNEKEIVVGDVDEPIDRILEDCIRTMKEEEECILKFTHPCINEDCVIPDDSTGCLIKEDAENQSSEGQTENLTVADENPPPDEEGSENKSEETPDEGKEEHSVQASDTEKADTESQSEGDTTPQNENASNSVEIRFQLLTYTREPEIWEMSITEKWRRASYHKQRGLELYSRGAYQYAFRRFGLTLKYVISLEHDVPSMQEEGMDIKGLKLSCYLNVAACQMRHHNYECVVINSSKALKMQPNNPKALYRRGSAYLQLQEYEKAKEDLDMAQQLEPKNQAVAKQQQLLKAQVQKLNQYYASAMKKYFS